MGQYEPRYYIYLATLIGCIRYTRDEYICVTSMCFSKLELQDNDTDFNHMSCHKFDVYNLHTFCVLKLS